MASQMYTNLTLVVLLLSVSCLNGFAVNEKIEAEDYTYGYEADIYNDCYDDASIVYVAPFGVQAMMEYDGIDFGAGVETITLRVCNNSGKYEYDVYLHLGSPDIPPFAVIAVGHTGAGCDFYTLTVFFQNPPTGVQNLFFTFPAGATLQFDWFMFNQTVV